MKNFAESDYAINKNAEGIVYRFADRTIEVTLEDYLRENPGKTTADFAELKALSDADYYDTDRSDYRQTWKNVPFYGLDNTSTFATMSTEDELISRAEQLSKVEQRESLVQKALDKLTDVQRRRYVMCHVESMSTRQIAEQEGKSQHAVMCSLDWAEKKIKKVLTDS